ncbi:MULTISPECIES: SDR family oxidoreductase [unclassified Mycobacterium]|uniref:SDR family oxidoreductase n=1 Tax=unclassified Mycobacterium TaxID=2642494 RepID=UPI0029C6714E|nr:MULTISPECIES: SDR family oxidoreductase [unclassified Mycobacterium]
MAAGTVINGKVVAITGGARGIGLATATALHRLGAKVAIGDIDEVAVKEAGTQLGLDVYAKLDVTDRASFEAFLDEVERQLGPLDVLINNAGICPTGKAVEESDAVSQRTIAINVFGVILGTKLAAARMIKRRKGHIINVASLAAITPMPGIATYVATKHAVLGYTDTVRLEMRGTGVAFSSVMPTLTNTAMVDGVSSARGLRNAEPEDIAAGIVGLIAKPKPHLMVTKAAGLTTLFMRNFTPRRLNEAVRRLIRADVIFSDGVDVDKRRDYEERARHT